MMLDFPYGNCDFFRIIDENKLYIDRTDHIHLLERTAPSLLFLRPRRFGKSLLLSVLENYYDIAKADDFDRLFGHLAIGQNPTAEHNQYLIMRWDFSAISPEPTYEEQVRKMTDYVNGEIEAFGEKYGEYLQRKIKIHPNNATSSWFSALSAVKKNGHKMYLTIDEYDNFANEVLMGGRPESQERYEALVFGEGKFKALFKAIKTAMAGRGLERAFITGVSPVVLHDVSSGYNIATNIYLYEEFNDLCGFTGAEVADLLQQVTDARNMSQAQYDEALETMRIYYNGSLFSDEGGEHIYNPTSTFYFLTYLQRRGHYPRKLLDSNLAPDHEKIAYVSRLPKGDKIIIEAMDEANLPSVNQLEDRFGIKQMLAENHSHRFTLSLLTYLGVLTLDGGISADGELLLRIPNLVARQLYALRLREMLIPDVSERDETLIKAKQLYGQGKMEPLADFIEARIFKIFDNRDYITANELTVKTTFLSLLFDDTFYMIDSELPIVRGYADLAMILRPEMRQYQLLDILIEFKFIKLGKHGLSGKTAKGKTHAELRAMKTVQKQLTEAAQQAKSYRSALKAKYGPALKLRTFAVVAVGFEKLLWDEVK